VTPFEPEWEGYVTLEFSNTTPLPAKIYAGEGCAQVLFFESDEICETSYKDRGGKYQGQPASRCRRPDRITMPASVAGAAGHEPVRRQT
jgi:deoxycytidine triphosphate deaminase